MKYKYTKVKNTENKSFSDYQEDFSFNDYHWEIENSVLSGENTFVDAGPGSGKTSTIFAVVLPSLIANDKETGCLFAFNKANANDFQSRIPESYSGNIKAGTIHSILLSLLRDCLSFKTLRINGPQDAGLKYGRYHKARKGKTRDMAEEMFPEENGNFISNVCRLVSLAKNSAFGIKSNDDYKNPDISDRTEWDKLIATYSIGGMDSDNFEGENDVDLIECAQKLLVETVKNKSEADFDDMLYFPMYYKCNLPDWDFLIMDESQDIFPITLEFISRMKDKGTQIVMVGDRKQAINGFAGSIAGAIDVALGRLGGNIMDMPVSFRCSKAACDRANEIFPNSVIAHDNAKEGEIIYMEFNEFSEGVDQMNGGDIILSRTHRNLIPFAMSFIKVGREFVYKGIRKWANEATRCLYHAARVTKDLSEIRKSMTEYMSELEDKYLGSPKMPKWVNEKRETIETLCLLIAGIEMENGTISTLRSYLTKLIAADKEFTGDCITLATIHASKGGEWETVFIVGDMISARAKTEEEIYSERCCSFVAVTRSKDKLVFVSIPKGGSLG